MMRIKARVVTLPHSLAPTNMCDARVRGQRAALCGERWRAHGKEQPWGEVARTMAAWLATRERRGACRILLPLRAGRRVRCAVLPAYGCMWLLVLSRTPITLSPVRSLGPQREHTDHRRQRCGAQHDPLYHRLHQFHAGASVMLMLRGALTLQKPKLISATLCAPARASVNIPPRRTAHATCKALGAARSPPLASPLKDVVPLAAAVV